MQRGALPACALEPCGRFFLRHFREVPACAEMTGNPSGVGFEVTLMDSRLRA
jgi:hypothetical protein